MLFSNDRPLFSKKSDPKAAPPPAFLAAINKHIQSQKDTEVNDETTKSGFGNFSKMHMSPFDVLLSHAALLNKKNFCLIKPED